MELEPERIDAVWRALQGRTPKSTSFPRSVEDRMVESRWVSDTELEDILFALDRRLDPPAVIDAAELASKLGLSYRFVYSRPRSRNDDVMGFRRLAAIDAAAFCIFLERLGFRIDLSSLCARLRDHLQDRTHLTDEEISVLFYDANRHRMPPISLCAPHRPWSGMRTLKLKTEDGYRIEYRTDDAGVALSLSVHAPRYRKPPATQSVECPGCGLTYMKGSPTDEREHRRTHRRWSVVNDPKPHRKLIDALVRDTDACWVGADAPGWKRKEVYERARLFRREFGYDFLQWSIEDDPDAIGFLFSDGIGRIIGACAFRPQLGNADRPWRLDWIWLCPDARRSGSLRREWQRFRQRFGDFDVEPPLSEAMKAFLIKQGRGDLIR